MINGGDFASMGALDVTGDNITTSATLGTQHAATLLATEGSVTNTGRVAGDDQAVVTAQTAVTNSGDLMSQTDVTVTAGTTLNNADSGQIIGGQTTTQSQSLGNAGLIAAQSGNLAITTDQTVDNTGTLVGVAALDIHTNGALRNEGDIVAQGTITVAGQNGAAAGAITNQTEGLINGGAGVQFAAASLENAGAIGTSAGALAVDLAGDLDNAGLLYSGTSSTYRLDGDFTNTNADVIAENDLTIAGLAGPRASSLLNSSGTIEAIAGNIFIAADAISNTRPAPTITTTSLEEVSGSDSPRRPGMGHTNTATLTTITTTTEAAENNGVAAQLLAGGNLTLNGTSVTNEYSQIAANGDVAIVADTVTNTGRDLIETTVSEAVTHHWRRYCDIWFFGECLDVDSRRWTTTNTSQTTATVDAVFGTIEAGGTLNGLIGGYLDNNAVRDGADQIGLESGDRALAAIDAVAISGDSLGDLTLSIDTVLDRSAVFDPATDPNAPYLVETRPDFIDASQFLGSDYFLGQLGGYNPDQTMRRFGDAYVETRLIREQIFGQTGGRYLIAGVDDIAQMRALYDNAIDAQRDLSLSLGVALTPDQITALTSDIVWLETQVVQGQEVLVPRLYLSQATLANIDLNSAQISGGQTNIFAGAIANSGALSGVNSLNLSAGSIFANTGGSLFSNADITINAGTVFANQSGRVIGGGDVSITAETVFNTTEKSRDEMPSGFTDRAQQTARIEAGDNLQINAAGSVGSVGGEFVAGDAISITAGDSIEITALELETKRDDEIKGGYDSEYRRTNTLATIAAGGDLSIVTGGDLTLRGVDASVGGDAALTADGSVNIASVQDVEQSDLKLDIGSSGLFSVETNVRQQDMSVDTTRTVIAANGGLTITANTGDITIDAATLQSGDETGLSAAGEVALLSETDSTFKQDYQLEEDLFWWSEGDEAESIETIEMVEVYADGGFTIDAGAGIVIEYQAHNNLDDALTTISAQPGLEWIGDMRTNPSVDWNGLEATVREWDYQEQGLTEAGALLVTAVVTYATGGVTAGWAESIASSWGLGAAGQAAVQAGLGNLLTQSSVALVNNQGDLGATLEQLGSDEGLRSLVTAMVSAGFTAQLNNTAGLGDFDPTTATAMENTIYRAQTGLIGASVNATVSTAINGGDIGDNLTAGWSNAMVMAGLAGAQHKIGDFGDANGLPDGSLPKILAHAVAGGLASEAAGGSFADGAMAAALSEAVGPLVGDTSLSLSRQAELQRLIGTTAILIASDGDVSAASFAGGVAASVEENNRQMHLEEIEWAESNAEEFQEWLCRNESQCLSLDEAQATLLLELNRRVSDDFRTLPENGTAAAFISSQAPSGLIVDGQSLFADLSQGRSEEYLNSTINMREFGTIAESLALVDQFRLAPGYAAFTAAQGIDGDLYAYFDSYGRSDLTQFILANKGMSDTMSAQAGMLLNAIQSGMIPREQVGETLDLVSELEGLSAGFRNVNVHAMFAGRQNGLLSLHDLYFGDGTEEGAAVVQAFGQSLQGLAISNAVVMRTLGMQTPGTRFTVDPAFRAADLEAGLIVNGSYVRNPTARNLNDNIADSGKIRLDGQLANGQYMYVVDMNGNIVIGTRRGQRMPHPTLLGGQNPRVSAAGMVEIRGGKIYAVDNASGHFKPGAGSLPNARTAFDNLPNGTFHPNFQGYVPYDR